LKKSAAIFFLSIYLFNLAGYSVFFRLLIDRADSRMETTLDNSRFREEELVELKVPLHVPYVRLSDDFERVSGHVLIEGKYYNYVKRRIGADTLYLYCISNNQADQLLNAKKEYGKQATDTPSSQKEKDTVAKKGGAVFQYQESIPDFRVMAVSSTDKNECIYRPSAIPAYYISTPYDPPELIA
jgi:hypothetical protein